MIPAIDDPPDGSGVLAQDGLFAGLEIDPPHVPVHASAEGLSVVGTEADIHDGGAVLEGLDQAALAGLTFRPISAGGVRLVQVHVLIPGGGEQARGRVRGEGERGDGVVRRLCELELRC